MNMMNALDSHSPLEALALNYINVGFLTIVNNLWTWVAVITAAVSFWRFRVATGGAVAATSSDESPSQPPPPPRYDQSSIGWKPVSEIKVPDVLLPRDDEPVSISGSGSDSDSGIMEVDDVKADGVTKGAKFFAVYYEENDCGEDDGELTAEESGVDGAVKVGEWWDSWERVLRMKMGDVGWYKYQDLTELNGNVVRLWDRCASIKEL